MISRQVADGGSCARSQGASPAPSKSRQCCDNLGSGTALELLPTSRCD